MADSADSYDYIVVHPGNPGEKLFEARPVDEASGRMLRQKQQDRASDQNIQPIAVTNIGNTPPTRPGGLGRQQARPQFRPFQG